MTQYLHQKHDPPELARTIDQLSFWASRFGALLFDNLDLRPNLNILDIGCATGFPLFEIAQVHGPSCRVTGIDLWQEALTRAAAKQRLIPQENVSLVQADAAHLPFANAAFDLIVSNLGVNNFDDAPAVMSECYRVANPGARVVLTTNLTGHMSRFYDIYRQTLTELGLSTRLPLLQAQEEHRGTLDSVRSLLQNASFQVTKVVGSSFDLRFLDSAAFFNHYLVRIGFLDGWRSVLQPEEEGQVFQALEKALDTLAAKEGELRMTIPMLYIEAKKD